MKKSIIITAAGIGKRFNSDLPKQFHLIGEKPVLLRTLIRLHEIEPEAEFLITLPNSYLEYWAEIITKFKCKIPHHVIPGGIDRFHSVKEALSFCSGDFIAVHDGVRPVVSKRLLNDLWTALEDHSAVVPALPLDESIRKIRKSGSKGLNRSEYRKVQTPQVFKRDVLEKAYELNYHESFTDDASLAEAFGYNIHMIEGDHHNIKITYPIDLLIVKYHHKNID